MKTIDESYRTGYCDALQRVEELFNQLFVRKKLDRTCSECCFVEEIVKMRLLVKSDQFSRIDKELGYFL